MTQSLMRLDLTSREFRVVFFLIDEIQGNQMKQRAIKTSQFMTSTGIPKQKVLPAINSLIEKGVIKRTKTKEAGWYLYEFSERNFGRVHATKVIHQDRKALRLIKGGVPETVTHDAGVSTQNGDSQVTETGTSPRSKSSLDPLREHKNPKEAEMNSRSGGDENETHFEKEMREHLERKKAAFPRGGVDYYELCERARRAASAHE